MLVVHEWMQWWRKHSIETAEYYPALKEKLSLVICKKKWKDLNGALKKLIRYKQTSTAWYHSSIKALRFDFIQWEKRIIVTGWYESYRKYNIGENRLCLPKIDRVLLFSNTVAIVKHTICIIYIFMYFWKNVPLFLKHNLEHRSHKFPNKRINEAYGEENHNWPDRITMYCVCVGTTMM